MPPDLELLRRLLERDDDSAISDVKKLSTQIRIKTEKIKELATTEYRKLSKGLWNLEALVELPDNKCRPFCPGALRLQSCKFPQLALTSIAEDGSSNEGLFICRYCSLQVGDRKSGAETQTEEWKRLLAKSHLMSSASFEDFRALYKCLPCYMAHEDKDFGSGDTLYAHIHSAHGGISLQTFLTKTSNEEDWEQEREGEEASVGTEENPEEVQRPGADFPSAYDTDASTGTRRNAEGDERSGHEARGTESETRLQTQDSSSDWSPPIDISQQPLLPVRKKRAADPMAKRRKESARREGLYQ